MPKSCEGRRPLLAKRAARKVPVAFARRRFFQLAAACLTVGCVGTLTFAFGQEAAWMDIGKSAQVQLGLNRWDMVVRVLCADEDVRHAAREPGLLGLPYEGAIGRIAAYLFIILKNTP